jgi:histidine triad (HIT) family protein
MECLFCNIVAGKIPTLKVAEDASHLAFLDINPSSPGHTVVIPKKHYSKLEDMPRSEAEAIFGFISELSKSVMLAVSAENCNIGINCGKIAGQEIPHVHFHIIPRYEGDGGTAVQGIVRMMVKKEELPSIAEKIKGAAGGGGEAKKEEACEAKQEEKKPEIKVVAKTEGPAVKKEEKTPEPLKKKVSKSVNREWQEFTHNHKDDVENLDEARNL